MRAKIDIALVREGKLHIQGWAFGKDPESPVKTVRALRGMLMLMFLRLCSFAPRTMSRSATLGPVL